jgi:superfamily II DNA or RNA helicase
MKVDPIKLNRQQEGVDKWFKSDCKGILDYHTGVGKTFTASLAMKKLELVEKSTYLIVVPSKPLEIQWKQKLIDYFPKYLIERIVLKTVQTVLAEDLQYEVGTLIIDELHEFHTEERLKLLDQTLVKHKRFLGLTASADDKNFRKILNFYKVIDYISAEEAKEKGYVADFIEYNIGLELSLREQDLYDRYTEVIERNMPKFNKNLRFAQLILSGGKDDNGIYYSGPGWAHGLAVSKGWKPNLNLNNENEALINSLWHPNNFIGYAKSLINSVRARRDLLCTANEKYRITVELLNKFNNVKTILFSESTVFADKIAILLNANKHPTVVYHSSLKTVKGTSPITGKIITMGQVRLKREALSKINNGSARVLSTAKSLDKGLDIEDLRFSITTSGSQSPTQYKQRNGRSTRKEENSMFADLPVLLVNLYMKNTQDELWLQKRQSVSKHEPIEVSSVSEIDYSPPANIEFSMLDL